MAQALTDAQVVEIREHHAWLRQIRDAEPLEERITNGEIDVKVAAKFKLSRAYVARLVIGQSRPEAGGPLDTERSEENMAYVREIGLYGKEEANRRRRLRRKGVDPTPEVVPMIQRAIIHDIHGREVQTIDLDPGHFIQVGLVPAPSKETPAP